MFLLLGDSHHMGKNKGIVAEAECGKVHLPHSSLTFLLGINVPDCYDHTYFMLG